MATAAPQYAEGPLALGQLRCSVHLGHMQVPWCLLHRSNADQSLYCCREEGRRLLIEALDSVRKFSPIPVASTLFALACHCCDGVPCTPQRRGKKVLVLDPRISGFLGQLAEVSLLKEHGVEQCAPCHPSLPCGHACCCVVVQQLHVSSNPSCSVMKFCFQ